MTAVPAFVAMFDLLGFRQHRRKVGTVGLYQMYDRGIAPGIAHAAALDGETAIVNGQEMFVPKRGPNSLEFRAISDTAIMWTKDASFMSFITMIKAAHALFQFGMVPGVAWRGAVGYGDLLASPDLVVGSALEDAYEGESSQMWAGVMLTPSCRDYVSQSGYIEQRRAMFLQEAAEETSDDHRRGILEKNANMLVQYDVPLQRNPKDGPIQYFCEPTWALDWTLQMYKGAAEQCLPVTDDLHAKRIRDNTIAFEAWARTRKS